MSHPVTSPPTPQGDEAEKYVSIAFLCRRYDKSRMTIYRWVKAGYLPAPVRIGPSSDFPFSKILEREKECARLSERAG